MLRGVFGESNSKRSYRELCLYFDRGANSRSLIQKQSVLPLSLYQTLGSTADAKSIYFTVLPNVFG